MTNEGDTTNRAAADAPGTLLRPRVRTAIHLPTGTHREPLRPAGNLSAWGLRLLRSEAVETDVACDLALAHVDGGEHLQRAQIVGCLPAFGTWHVLDIRFDDALMPMEWVDPFRWQRWTGPAAGPGQRVGRHPRDPARLLRVRPRTVGAMLVTRPDAITICDTVDLASGIDLVMTADAVPNLLVRDLLGEEHRDRAARRLLLATAANDWQQVCAVTRGIRGYACGHADDTLANAAQAVLAAFESQDTELQRQVALATLVEHLLVA